MIIEHIHFDKPKSNLPKRAAVTIIHRGGADHLNPHIKCNANSTVLFGRRFFGKTLNAVFLWRVVVAKSIIIHGFVLFRFL